MIHLTCFAGSAKSMSGIFVFLILLLRFLIRLTPVYRMQNQNLKYSVNYTVMAEEGVKLCFAAKKIFDDY